MSSPEETIPQTEQVGQRLMAYLDGELDAAARKAIQEQLSTDPDLRQHMKELQQTWDMLDDLPREQVADDFTRVTVEMVAVHAEGDAERRARAVARWRMAALCMGLIVAVVAGIAGFTLSSRYYSRENRQLVEDLPILQELDSYRSAGSIDFLRALYEEGLFQEGTFPEEPSPPAGGSQAPEAATRDVNASRGRSDAK